MLAMVFFYGGNTSYERDIEEKTTYKATVCVYKNGELVDCVSNILTNIGAEFVEDQLTSPQTANKTEYITLSSTAADCTAGAEKLANEITTNGLEKASCTITDLGTGNWSCENTFTATGSLSNVQVAGYNWNATAQQPDMFACGTFTSVNLEANDQILVRWNITISSA